MRSTSTGSRKSINDRMPENIAPKSHLPNYLTIKNNSNKGNVLTDPYQICFFPISIGDKRIESFYSILL